VGSGLWARCARGGVAKGSWAAHGPQRESGAVDSVCCRGGAQGPQPSGVQLPVQVSLSTGVRERFARAAGLSRSVAQPRRFGRRGSCISPARRAEPSPRVQQRQLITQLKLSTRASPHISRSTEISLRWAARGSEDGQRRDANREPRVEWLPSASAVGSGERQGSRSARGPQRREMSPAAVRRSGGDGGVGWPRRAAPTECKLRVKARAGSERASAAGDGGRAKG
jgi:hypothetical protein